MYNSSESKLKIKGKNGTFSPQPIHKIRFTRYVSTQSTFMCNTIKYQHTKIHCSLIGRKK